MSVINAGELKDRLNIVARTNGLDENGFSADTFETIYSLRCKKKTVSTKEFAASDKENSKIMLKFIVRKRPEIDNDKIVEYKGQKYDIKHVHEIDEQFLELTAEESWGA